MNRIPGYACVLFGVAFCAITPASAQRGKGDSEFVFDVASIKPSPARTQAQAILSRFPRAEPGGRWAIGYTPFREILGWLYRDYPIERIVGGPSWVDSQRFDIEARTSPGTSAERMTLMARRLLMDRFSLRLGSTMRPVDVYALVITRDDKKPGPGVRPKVDCESRPPVGPNAPIQSSRPFCRLIATRVGDRVQLSAGASPISELVSWIQNRAGRPVVDRTGLTGEFALRFDVPFGTPLVPTAAGQANAPGTSADIFTAVREQLGMNLVPRKEPMNFLTIEHVEMPTPN